MSQNKQKVEGSQFIQFKSVKIVVKHFKLFNQTLYMNPRETISDLKTFLCQSTLFHLYQNYHFQLHGKQLGALLQFSQISQGNQSDLQLDILIDPFDERTAKHHIRKIQQIIKNPIIWAVFNVKQKQQKPKQQIQMKEKQLNIETCLTPNLENPYFSKKKHASIKQVISFLNFSGYNPPPSYRKLYGDFFYLHLRTLQSIDYHITANPRGFYINNSNINYFDPNINPNFPKIYYNFMDLLNQISPKFKKTFEENIQILNLTELQKLAVISNYKNKSIWLKQKNQIQHLWNANKSENQFINESIKDWNQVFQAQTEMPTNDMLIDQLNKQKALIKIYSQFTLRATQGAKALIQGRMAPLNPMDDKSQHIYIHNSIFYSLAKQTPFDYSQQKGIQATPSVSAINIDLQNLSRLLELQIKDIHVLHMILIQYRGYKVICQSIIPGILSAQQLQCTQYGSIDDGKTIQNDKQFEFIMTKICDRLDLDSNIQFIDALGVKKRIAGSIQVKGILGSDRRKYILDLLRLSPRDYNFLGPNYHTCVLRSQLIDSYKLSKQVQEKNEYSSLKINKLKIPINTNLQTGIQFVKSDITQKQEDQLRDMAKFLKQICIPKVIVALTTTDKKFLSDSKGIIKIFHQHGVNVRYLGQVLKHPSINEHPQLRIALQRVILVKSLKHLFRIAMRDCSPIYLSTVICRLLNCVFANQTQINQLQQGKIIADIKPHVEQQNKNKKKKKKEKEKQKNEIVKQGQVENYINISNSLYINIKPSEVWSIICKLAQTRYQHTFPQKINEFKGFTLPFNKLATLRDLCLSIGLKIQKKNYHLSSQKQNLNQMPFNLENIIQLYPITKHIPFHNKSIQKLIQNGDQLLAQYKIQEGIQIYNNVLQYLTGLYGGIHEDIAIINQKISNIYYRLGDYQSAISCLRNAMEMFEILYGEDNIRTIQSISNLGLFYFSKNQKQKALYYLYKSLFLSNLSFGQTYPETIVNYMNVSAIYQQNKQYQQAIIILLQALEIIVKIYGKEHLNSAACYTALASLHYQINDLRQCIDYQEKSLTALKNSLKQNDPRIINGEGLLNYYKEMLNAKRVQEENNIKKPVKKQQGTTNSYLRVNVAENDPNSQRNILLKKLQQAKWNSRMGFKK